MGNVWFTSDLHLGHRLVAKLRGFGEDEHSTTAHDAAVFDGWTACVRDDDQVWVLGDVALTDHETALQRIGSLPGVKHLVTGNHDPCHPMHREAHKWQRRYMDVFASVQTAARRRIAGQDVLLSHFPYTVDRGFEVRYSQWRLPDLGLHLLHGHTHQPERVTSPREVHVGLDAWSLAPVPLRVIQEMIK